MKRREENLEKGEPFLVNVRSKPRFSNKRYLWNLIAQEDYGISEVTWSRHIVEALELRPEAALSKGAIMDREKVPLRSRKRSKFRFI